MLKSDWELVKSTSKTVYGILEEIQGLLDGDGPFMGVSWKILSKKSTSVDELEYPLMCFDYFIEVHATAYGHMSLGFYRIPLRADLRVIYEGEKGLSLPEKTSYVSEGDEKLKFTDDMDSFVKWIWKCLDTADKYCDTGYIPRAVELTERWRGRFLKEQTLETLRPTYPLVDTKPFNE